MTRQYRIDIEMVVGQSYDEFNADQFKNEIFPYFCAPDLDPTDSDAKEWEEEIADGIERFGHHASALDQGYTSVYGSRITDFCGSYRIEQYKEDVIQQIERLKKELPFPFEVEIQVHFLEHDPAAIIKESNLQPQ
jgi:hypothetical protein